MKRIGILIAAFFLITGFTEAQSRYYTKSGRITFYSNAPLEDIEASTKTVAALLDATTGTLQFSVVMKSFEFKKALMQEHFNENYIESDKYPKAEFLGSYTGDVNTAKEGKYPVQVKGQLTLHGVTKPVEVPATIEVKGSKLSGTTDFKVTPGDFNIQIPALVREKIARQIDVHISVECNPK